MKNSGLLVFEGGGGGQSLAERCVRAGAARGDEQAAKRFIATIPKAMCANPTSGHAFLLWVAVEASVGVVADSEVLDPDKLTGVLLEVRDGRVLGYLFRALKVLAAERGWEAFARVPAHLEQTIREHPNWQLTRAAAGLLGECA